MEEDLDMIADGEMAWTDAIREFYRPFAEDVKKAQAEMPVTKSGPEPIGRACPNLRQGTGHSLWALWKIHFLQRLPRLPLYRTVAGEDRCALSQRWRRTWWNAKRARDAPSLAVSIIRIAISLRGRDRLQQPCPKCNGLLVIANKREAQCIKLSGILPVGRDRS